MVIAAILLGVCQILCTFCWCLFIRHVINAKQAEIEARAERALREWVESPGEGQPSKLANLVDVMGATIGSAAARSLTASVKQQSSSVAQVANGAADMLQAQTNPLAALISGGKRGKGAAVMRLAQLLGPMFMGGNGNHGTTDASGYTGRKHRD